MTHLYLLSNVSGKRLNENFPASKNALFKIEYKNWHAQPEFLAKNEQDDKYNYFEGKILSSTIIKLNAPLTQAFDFQPSSELHLTPTPT
ncbi:MAG: hypothetical protein Q8L68_07945, partial [Methylococcales bacterium]|nr:hypothetical protein [Methylococcales bacterium]